MKWKQNLTAVERNNLYKALQEIINKYADEIDKYDYDSVYKHIKEDGWHSSVISGFTEIVYGYGIDPLKYMKSIPAHFADYAEIPEIVVPANIEYVEPYAFGMHQKRIVFEHTQKLPVIEDTAFFECIRLKEIKCSEDLWKVISKLNIDSSVKWVSNGR